MSEIIDDLLTKLKYQSNKEKYEESKENKSDILSKDDFIKYLNFLVDYDKYESKLANLNINIFENINVSHLVESYIDMLSILTHDENDWISYWMYELSHGEEYHAGDVLDENNNNIDMSTPEKLYDFLYSEYKEGKSCQS